MKCRSMQRIEQTDSSFVVVPISSVLSFFDPNEQVLNESVFHIPIMLILGS